MNLITNEATLVKEEAHWSTFRKAVASLQHTLVGYTPAAMETGDTSRHGRRGSEVVKSIEKPGQPASGKDLQQQSDSSPTLSKKDETLLSCTGETFQREHPQSALEYVKDGLGVDLFNCNASEEQQNSDVEEFDSRKPYGKATLEQNNTHRYLELTGLEKVNKGEYDRNLSPENNLTSPTYPLSLASHTTDPLSMAELQLAETRLKLAMTESERDELEFRLMQND